MWIAPQVLLLLLGLLGSTMAFVRPTQHRSSMLVMSPSLYANKNGDDERGSPFSEFFRNLDDVIDDFMCKRMGNGEVFYGQRRSNPSKRPNTTGKYNGMGASDKVKIEERRLIREMRMEELRRKQDAEAKNY